MSTRSESWSRPASPQWAAVTAAVAVLIFLASWGALHRGFFTRDQVADTPIYERYGDAMVAGQMPYRDFAVEYPPAALPAFVLPSLVAARGDQPAYRDVFEALMVTCGAAVVVLLAVVLVGEGVGAAGIAGVALAALAPLALGSVVRTRFDFWPALVTVGALAALLFRRQRLGLGVLGLGVAAKLYPGVLLPLALAYVWRRSGRREALVCAGIFAAVAVACYLPFFVIAPGGVWHSVTAQTTRPLQIESLGSSFLLAAHQAFGLSITMHSSHGSQNLAGALPDALAVLQTVLQVVVLAYVWWAFASGPPSRDRLLRSSAAAVCTFVALGKVLSPQFLIWLVPLVALVRGRRGAAAVGVLALAMVLTQIWFPYRYWRLALEFDATASWLVLVRDFALVGLLAVLAWPERRGHGISARAR